MKKQDLYDKTLTHREVLNFAIMYLVKTYPKAIECIKNGSIYDPENGEAIQMLYMPWLFKIRMMCEAYKVETGKDYELEAYCGISPYDIEID